MQLTPSRLLLPAAVALAAVATADVVEIPASKDNTLFEDVAGSLSNGAGPAMFAGETNIGSLRRALVAFDVAGSVPAGATIHGVSLRLTMSMTLFGPHDVSFHRTLADWGEGTSSSGGGLGGGGAGAAATAGDATWIHTFSPASFWASAGGDFTAAASATRAFNFLPTPPYTVFIATSGLAADVQFWLDNPGQNFGWLLKGDESQFGTAKRFETRESATPAFRPALFVCYTAPGAEPGEPFCFGDGSGAACPCANESSAPCRGCEHSGGEGMGIQGSGSTSILADDLTVTATDCPPNNTGIFYSGTTVPNGGIGSVLFDGIQCAGGDVRRFQGVFQSTGNATDTGFVAQDPSGIYFQIGVTYHLQ